MGLRLKPQEGAQTYEPYIPHRQTCLVEAFQVTSHTHSFPKV